MKMQHRSFLSMRTIIDPGVSIRKKKSFLIGFNTCTLDQATGNRFSGCPPSSGLQWRRKKEHSIYGRATSLLVSTIVRVPPRSLFDLPGATYLDGGRSRKNIRFGLLT